jgi:hypothetical protein
MREQAASESCGLTDLLEREGIELRRDLALEPRLVTLARMLARPPAIALVCLGDRLASRAVHFGAASWIVARSGLRCEHFASRFDRSQSMLAARLRPKSDTRPDTTMRSFRLREVAPVRPLRRSAAAIRRTLPALRLR